MLRKIVAFIACIAIAYVPAALGNLVQPSAWYDALAKPPLQPPGWAFGAVWTPLYFAMGVALFLIWRSDAADKMRAFGLFAIQAVFNASWTLVFFGLEQVGFGVAIILALFVVILACIREFAPVSRRASWLFVPYAAWVAFASYLNIGVATLN